MVDFVLGVHAYFDVLLIFGSFGPDAYGINDQYFLGPKFMVAPVTLQNATSRSVYFPKGETWVNFFTKETVTGGKTVTVSAPLDQIPVYTRA